MPAGSCCSLAGSLLGEIGQTHVEAFSLRSLVALAYLIVFGSIVAFTAYTWLLANVPVSTVGTYAYVNPIVAVALGAIFLDGADHAADAHRGRDHHRRRGGDGLRASARRPGDTADPRRSARSSRNRLAPMMRCSAR